MQENIDIPMDNKEAIAVVEKMITSKTELSTKTWASKPLQTLAVQHLLSYIGIFNKNREGIYGPETKAAVLAFQENIFADFPEKQTGIFNKETAELLLEAVRPMKLSSETNTIQNNTNIENTTEKGISFGDGTAESVILTSEDEKKQTTYYRNDTDGLYYTKRTKNKEVSTDAIYLKPLQNQ